MKKWLGQWNLFLSRHQGIKKIIERHGSLLFNWYLFVNILGWTFWQGYLKFLSGRLDFIEISFIFHNLVLISVILLRTKHQLFDKNIKNQLVALFAFYSGLAFMGQSETSDLVLLQVSQWIIVASNILGILTLLNLGRSFGILIALRKVKTGGLYSVVRHPMYASDILLRIGFLVSHFNFFTLALFFLSSGAYVYRANLEEKLLCKDWEYQEYMKKVKYRFIPYVY